MACASVAGVCAITAVAESIKREAKNDFIQFNLD